MRRSTRTAGILVLLGALSVAASVAHASAAKSGKRVFKTRGNVTQLSASAHRVAFVQDINSQCERLVVWQPARRKATRLPRTGACSDPSSTGQGVSDLLLAGKRLVWIEFGGGNFRELVVHSTRLDAKKPRAARHTDFLAHRVDSQWGHDGTYIDGLRGHPSSRNKQELVVWNTWDGCFYDPGLIGNECEPPAELLPSEAALVSWNRTLWRLAGNGGEAVATGAAAMSIVAAGDERIAVKSGPVPRTGPGGVAPVAEPAGTLTMVGPDGDVSSSFTLPAGTYYGTELTNNAFTLATLRDDELELYSTTSGELVASFPTKPPKNVGKQRYALTGVRKGLAVYVSGKRIHVIRLSDGKSFSIRPARAHGAVNASLVSDGLFFSHNVGATKPGKKNGRVVYLPRAVLDKRLAAAG